MSKNVPVLYDAKNRPISFNKMVRKAGPQAKAFLSGFKGANADSLSEWAFLPLDINQILRNDLRKLRARSRDLARNDDTSKRFLHLLKQNVLGHAGIRLQAKNKLSDKKTLDIEWNEEIEREWEISGRKRRWRGQSESLSACGQMSRREMSWLALMTRAVDGEYFLHLLHGYPHNKQRFAVRFLNPDLLDSSYYTDLDNGNRIEMGIEFDQFDRPINYHFNVDTKYSNKDNRIVIPASQIIHSFRKEFPGQIRGIPDFATIMHKTKMLNGVNEAIVVGWRVAAAKMGFITVKDYDLMYGNEDGTEDESAIDRINDIEATPGTFEAIPEGLEFKSFDPDYPSSTFESGHKVFMQQISNGLNVSSPTLSNNYEGVNYSSLRQALLEDREGWRCVQAEMIEGFYQPLFDEWYQWGVDVVKFIRLPESKRHLEPKIVWQPRGFPWVDPLKEQKAHNEAVEAKMKTRQSVMAETSGADFKETIDEIADEEEYIESRGLSASTATALPAIEEEEKNDA